MFLSLSFPLSKNQAFSLLISINKIKKVKNSSICSHKIKAPDKLNACRVYPIFKKQNTGDTENLQNDRVAGKYFKITWMEGDVTDQSRLDMS